MPKVAKAASKAATKEPPRTKTWRVIGLWRTGLAFLVVMGHSEEDCRRRLRDALWDYTREDLERMDSAWFEEWVYNDWRDEWEWLPTDEVSMRTLRLRAAAYEQHADRRPEARGQRQEGEELKATG